MNNLIRQKIMWFANPNIMFFSLMWMMVIVIIGTVAQKYIGLYQAQHIFFSSWFLWLGPLPLPGGMLVMAIIFSCLVIKLIFASEWSVNNSGIIITHLGGLLLLVGGLLTTMSSSEGAMVIYEGATSNFITDYHARELTVYEETSGDKKLFSLPLEKLTKGQSLEVPGLPLHLEIITACRNCDIINRVPTTDSVMLRGRAQDYALYPVRLDKEDEQNKSGVEFKVSGADPASNGLYFTVDFMAEAPAITVHGKNYKIVLEKRHTYLPFAITLKKFDKQLHPGTDIARSYQSTILLKDGKTEWPSVIQMNEPLRYKGYTFYQSSFLEEGDKKATVLAVVKNAGRWFPYISGIVICLGLIVHLILRLPKLVRGIVAGRNTKSVASLCIIFSALLLSLNAHASTSAAFDYTAFKTIPVLDQGRVKPMQTVAQNYLKQFYGATSLPDQSAIEWFAELIFSPDAAYARKIFKISDPRVVDALSLEHRTPHVYSYHEVGLGILNNEKAWQGLFDVPEDQLTSSQKELLTTYNSVQTMGQLSRSFSLYFPDFVIPAGPLATALGVPPDSHLSYVDMQGHKETLDNLARLAAKPEPKIRVPPFAGFQDPGVILDLKKELEDTGADHSNNLLKIIPPPWDSQKTGKLWYAPWGITFEGQGSPQIVKFLSLWRELLVAYRQGNSNDFLSISKNINVESEYLAGDAVSISKLKLEVIYNDYSPFKISMSFYALAFVLVLLSLMFS